jgi:hypothetical protein
VDGQLANTPINIVEREPGHFSCPKAQSNEQEDDGAIAKLNGGRVTARCNQPLDIVTL